MANRRKYKKKSFWREYINEPCVYGPNKKYLGTKCRSRYDTYMVASTFQNAILLGSKHEDIVWDLEKGFLKLRNPVHQTKLMNDINNQ